MDQRKWHTSKKYPGVRWREGERGSVLYYLYKDVHGKAILKKVGPLKNYTLQYAANLRQAALDRQRHGTGEAQQPITWEELAEKYNAWSKNNKLSYKHDETRWRLHLAPTVGELLLDQVTPRMVEQLKNGLIDKKLSPATVKQAIGLLRAMYNKARAWGLATGAGPTVNVRMPKIDNQRERSLTPEETKKLLEELKPNGHAYGQALFALYTGARMSEIYRLTWHDIDMYNATVVYRGTKNGKSRRVPLNDTMLEYLAGLKRGAPGQLLYPKKDGGQQKEIGIYFKNRVNKLFNENVDNPRHRVVFHTLRHTFATRLVAGGVPLNVVMDLMGHSSMAMLQRYSHLIPGARQDAVRLLDK